MNYYNLFTLQWEKRRYTEFPTVFNSATVINHKLANGTIIPAITVGEEGPGRKLGMLPVHLTRKLHSSLLKNSWLTIEAGRVGRTESGFELYVDETRPNNVDKAIVVMKTPSKGGGERGNYHTGDVRTVRYQLIDPQWVDALKEPIVLSPQKTAPRILEILDQYNRGIVDAVFDEVIRDKLIEILNTNLNSFRSLRTYHDFPGQILVDGIIAKGDEGLYQPGTQLIALMPRDVWFRTSFWPDHNPDDKYYLWDGNQMVSTSASARELFDIQDTDDVDEWL